MGFIFQAFYLLPTLRAVENVQVACWRCMTEPIIAPSAPRLCLKRWASAHRMRHFPNELSAGERQRVAIARALANDPTILLADEPTGNLDSVNSAHIMEILRGIREQRGMTMIDRDP